MWQRELKLKRIVERARLQELQRLAAQATAVTDAGFIRKKQVAAFSVIPTLLRGLEEFLETWRAATTQAHVGEEYIAFHDMAAHLMTRFENPEFWSERESKWTHRMDVRSPFRPNERVSPARDQQFGDNPWFDRFLRARQQFNKAVEVFESKPQAKRLLMGAHEELTPDVRSSLQDVREEFTGVFGLCLCDPSIPIPDMSLTGRKPGAKWYTGGGAFRVEQDTAYVPLTDPQRLRENLRCRPELFAVGQTLASLPGSFGDFEERIVATIARLQKEQFLSLGHVVASGESIFRARARRVERGSAGGFASVGGGASARRQPRVSSEDAWARTLKDLNEKLQLEKRGAQQAQASPTYLERMKNVTLEDVYRDTFKECDVTAALGVRGIVLPDRIKPSDRVWLLASLVSDLSPGIRNLRFLQRQLVLTDKGGGQWQVESSV